LEIFLCSQVTTEITREFGHRMSLQLLPLQQSLYETLVKILYLQLTPENGVMVNPQSLSSGAQSVSHLCI